MSKKQQRRIDPLNDPDDDETVRRKKRKFRNDPRIRQSDQRKQPPDDRLKKGL